MKIDGMKPEMVREDIKYLKTFIKRSDLTPLKLEPKHIIMFESIVAILFDNDPIGIKRMSEIMTAHIYSDGTVDDYEDVRREYMPEAALIVHQMKDWTSVDKLKSIIDACFWQMFNNKYQDDYITKIAREIWNAWLKYQGLSPIEYTETCQPLKWEFTTITVD